MRARVVLPLVLFVAIFLPFVRRGERIDLGPISVSQDGMAYESGDVSDLPAVIEFDPGSFVLTAFGRFNGGTVRGDKKLADRFLGGFFRI